MFYSNVNVFPLPENRRPVLSPVVSVNLRGEGRPASERSIPATWTHKSVRRPAEARGARGVCALACRRVWRLSLAPRAAARVRAGRRPPLRVSVCRCARSLVRRPRPLEGDARVLVSEAHGAGEASAARGRGGRAAQGGGGQPGGLQPGGRPAADRAGARAAAAVRAQQHARRQLLHAGQGPVAGGGARDGLERGGRPAQVVAHPQLVLAPPAQRAARRLHQPRPPDLALVPGRRPGLPARAHGHRHAALGLLRALLPRGGPGLLRIRAGRQALRARALVHRGQDGVHPPALATRRLQRLGARLVLRLGRDVAVLPVLPRHPPRLPRAARAAPAPVQAPLPAPAARAAGRGGRGAGRGQRWGAGPVSARPPRRRRPPRHQTPRAPALPPRLIVAS